MALTLTTDERTELERRATSRTIRAEDATRAKTSYVREAKSKENRFIMLLNSVNALWKDVDLHQILREEKLFDRPVLGGEFHYESQ